MSTPKTDIKKSTKKSKKTSKKTSKKASKKTSDKASKKSTIKASKKTTSVVSKKYEPDFSYIPTWSKKTGKSVDDIKKMIVENMDKIRKKYPSFPDEKVHGKARMRVAGILKSDMQNTATMFYFRKLFNPPTFDFGNKKYKEHLELYKTNPKYAKDKNYVIVSREPSGKLKVTPVDEKPKVAWKNAKGEYDDNPNFRKPLPLHNWIQTIGGIAIPTADYDKGKWDQLKALICVSNRQFSDPTNDNYLGDKFEYNGWYKMGFNVKKKKTKKDEAPVEPIFWDVTPSSFKPIFEESIEDVDPDTVLQCYNHCYVPLIELNEYHEAMVADQHEKAQKKGKELYKTTCNDIMCTTGQVIDIQLSDGTSSHKIIIDTNDMDVDYFGADDDTKKIPNTTTVWMNSDIKITFGKYSEVIIFGSTSRMRKKDMLTNQYTDEWNQTQISGKGFFIIEVVKPEGADEEYESEEDYEYESEESTTADLDDESSDSDDSDDSVEVIETDDEESDEATNSDSEEWEL